MKFINRKQELARLDRLARSKNGAVAVVWGRRRVGKTRLLLEWTQKHKGVFYTADESSAPIQRQYLAMALQQVLPGFSDVEYMDWATLFSRLAHDAAKAKWRGPLVIDELPYLIAESPELPSILQKFIDHEAKNAKLIIALCGSSQRMMQGAILEHSAPLYGRADELIKLGPILLGYMKEALKLSKPRQIVEAYSIWGGIPRYWELLDKNKGSFLVQIDRLVLDPMGPLHDETTRLLLEEIPSAIHLRPILDAIGQGTHRLSEIAGRIGQPVTSLMRPIQRLIELDLVQREVPYGTDWQNSKKTLYKIKDPFVRFWFDCVASKRSLLTQATSQTRIHLIKESLPSQFSKTWEELCRLAIPFLSHKLGKVFGQAGRFWHNQDHEWDVLAESLDRKFFLLGEAKWISKPPSATWVYAAIEDLRGKGFPPIKRHDQAQLLYVLFIPERPKKLALPKDVKVIEAKDVIEVMH